MTGPLAKDLADYLALRRALGYRLARPEKLLTQFLKHQLVKWWVGSFGLQPGFLRSWRASLRKHVLTSGFGPLKACGPATILRRLWLERGLK